MLHFPRGARAHGAFVGDSREVCGGIGPSVISTVYTGEDTPPTPNLTPRKTLEELGHDPGTSGSEARFLLKLKGLVAKMVHSHRAFFLEVARRLAAR